MLDVGKEHKAQADPFNSPKECFFYFFRVVLLLLFLAVFGLGGGDLTYEKPLHIFAVSLRSMNLPISRRYFFSSLETNVIASPVAAARPVRPIRWT